jgi:hypothetical protein
MVHELKTLPKYWDDVRSGRKTFEVRRNDRNFNVGDSLELYSYSGEENWQDGEFLEYWVSYILEGGQFGIEPGFVVLGLHEATSIS